MIGFAKFYIIKHVIPYELDVISGKITDEQKVQMLKNDVDYDWGKLAQEFIQSLSTKQLPKEFVPETDYGKCLEERCLNHPCDGKCKQLKTITNSQGKEEIQGTYKY